MARIFLLTLNDLKAIAGATRSHAAIGESAFAENVCHKGIAGKARSYKNEPTHHVS